MGGGGSKRRCAEKPTDGPINRSFSLFFYVYPTFPA